MLIVAVTRLAAELSQPCRTGTEVLLPRGAERVPAEGRPGWAVLCCREECDRLCRCPGNAEGGSSTEAQGCVLGISLEPGRSGQGSEHDLENPYRDEKVQ